MASGSRTLTLKLLADIDQFTQGLDKSSNVTKSTADQITDFGKKAALAFAAAGAAIGAYAKVAIENAAADEAAQRKLALTIENTTDATKGQIAAVEDYISKTSMAIGVTDDELRPAFARLVRSTKDVDEATRLLNLALDVSAATGKPLETIANALGKAYDGNAASLGRLGLGLDASTLKSKDFNAIFDELNSTFGNFAENESVSTEKMLARVKIALDEANESIGAALLPVVQDLTAWLLNHFVPALQAVVGGLTGDESVLKGLNGTYEAFYLWGERIRNMIDFVVRFKDELAILAGVLATVFVASKVVAGIQAIIAALAALRAAYITTGIAAAFATAGVSVGTAIAALAGVGIATGLLMSTIKGGGGGGSTVFEGNPNLLTGGGGGGGGGSTAGGAGALGSIGGSLSSAGGSVKKVTAPLNLAEQTNLLLAAKAASVNNDASINTRTGVLNKLNAMGGSPVPPIVLNVSGAIDPEGTARTIVNTLNNSFYRGTNGAGGLVG